MFHRFPYGVLFFMGKGLKIKIYSLQAECYVVVVTNLGSSGLKNMKQCEYPFITITSRSTLTRVIVLISIPSIEQIDMFEIIRILSEYLIPHNCKL